MLSWHEFALQAPEISNAGAQLIQKHEIAFLATVSAKGRPRIHPFIPKILGHRLIAFIMDSSPKIRDLENRRQYSIHTLPGKEDEEFSISGEAQQCNSDNALRLKAENAMGFATGVDEHHILYEFRVDSALWTTWLDFGTANHRPKYITWRFPE